jgi:hypothetical protein
MLIYLLNCQECSSFTLGRFTDFVNCATPPWWLANDVKSMQVSTNGRIVMSGTGSDLLNDHSGRRAYLGLYQGNVKVSFTLLN